MRKSLIVLAILLAGCAAKEQKQAMEEMKQPINCTTARGDLRMLGHEKADVGRRIAEGISAVYPAGLVVGAVTRTEKTKYEVATGEYNKMIDKRIAEIKQTCGI